MAGAKDIEVSIPSNADVEATIGGTPMASMWWQGSPVLVPANEVGKFQALGFLAYKPEDLSGLANEVDQLTEELSKSVHRFVDGVLGDGTIDSSDGAELHVLQQGMTRLEGRLQDIINVSFQNYPVKETRETAKARDERIVEDASYHGVSVEEMKHRYGIKED